MKRLVDLSARELSALLRVPVEKAQEHLESADSHPFMQAPVEEVREHLRHLQESGELDEKVPRDVATRVCLTAHEDSHIISEAMTTTAR